MNKQLMKGNEAIAEAAIRAGCRAFFGYPITPSSEIPEYMSLHMPEAGGVFLQAESEVAAINMVYGSAATGRRVMTASSGPGFSLKQEGISYLSAAELPCLVVNVTRHGPGLGGIQPEQSDYFQMTKGGGHGGYRLPVLAPVSVQETADLTRKAFDIADRYRTPVILTLDGYLGQMMEPVSFPDKIEPATPDGWPLTGSEGRERRVIGNYTLSAELGEQHSLNWQKKFLQMEQNLQEWEEVSLDDAEYVIVAYGTSARIAESVLELARSRDIRLGLLRPISLWPFPNKAFPSMFPRVKGFLALEMSMGQLVEDVRLAVNGRAPVKHYGRLGGMVPGTEEVLAEITAMMAAEGGN